MSREEEIEHFLSLDLKKAREYAQRQVNEKKWKPGDALMAMKFWRSKHLKPEDQTVTPESAKEIFK